MEPSHVVIDLGPNALTVLLALIAALASVANVWISSRTQKSVSQGNSELASRLARLAEARQAAEALKQEFISKAEKE